MKYFTLVVFLLTYLLVIIFSKKKHIIALLSACLLFISGSIPFEKVIDSIDINIILMLFSMMGLVSLFIDSKMPDKLADGILRKVPNYRSGAIVLCIFTGIVSAFIDNVATVLMIAPIAFSLSKKANVSPVKLLICIAVSSNLQGASTMIGDTTSIMFASYAKFSFFDFIIKDNKPSLFFAILIASLLTIPFLYFVFRKENKKISIIEESNIKTYIPSILIIINIISLILVSLFGIDVMINETNIINGLICFISFIISLILYLFKRRYKEIKSSFSDVDYETLLFLLSLFIIVGSIIYQGIINDIAIIFIRLANDNIIVQYTIIVISSVIISAFIDNIPFVAAMLPVVHYIGLDIGVDPTILYFGLMIGSTLGGNITPIGASANVSAIGMLKKNGYSVSSKEFIKIGLPFTLIACISGYLFILLIWG